MLLGGTSMESGSHNHDQLFADADRFAREASIASDNELMDVVRGLLNISESGQEPADQRKTAAELLAALATRFDSAFESVVEIANRYIRTQYIDDASPYSPNGFDILAQVVGRQRSIV